MDTEERPARLKLVVSEGQPTEEPEYRNLNETDLEQLKRIAGEVDAEVETLAYPGHLDEQDLVLTDSFFKVIKNKDESPHYRMIKQLIFEDADTLARNGITKPKIEPDKE